MDGQLYCCEEKIMPQVLVLYYSFCGHIEAIVAAVAEGVREAGAQVDIKRIPKAGTT
jgi:NAD(P)H dehydrogenase (quinone)